MYGLPMPLCSIALPEPSVSYWSFILGTIPASIFPAVYFTRSSLYVRTNCTLDSSAAVIDGPISLLR